MKICEFLTIFFTLKLEFELNLMFDERFGILTLKQDLVEEAVLAQSDDFLFSISKSGSVVAVHFSGVLGLEGEAEFRKFTSEVLSDPSIRAVVMDFQSVTNVTIDLIPSLVLFQRQCRIQRMQVRLCAFPEQLKKKLLRLGVIRNREISASLRNGIKSLGNDPQQEVTKAELLKKAV